MGVWMTSYVSPDPYQKVRTVLWSNSLPLDLFCVDDRAFLDLRLLIFTLIRFEKWSFLNEIFHKLIFEGLWNI